MQIKTADRTQRYGVRDNSNLSASVNASKASAQMYDELTNSFLNLADVATTSAINSEIRDATLEGEMKGTDASRKDGDGSFKGYEKDTEVFKWDVASNKASKTSFEANVAGRASSTMKTLSKDVNGDKATYKTVSQKLLDESLKNVEDEQQRQYITNSYAKSYNQNMHTVSTQYIKIEGKKAKDGWEAGRESFEEDYGVKLQAIARDQKAVRDAVKNNDMEEADRLIAKIEKDKAELNQFSKARASKGVGGVQLGVLTTEGVKRDTHADIVNAITTSSVQSYRNAETNDEKKRIVNMINELPEAPAEGEDGDEIVYMSPRSKAKLMKALDDEELQEQKMWKSEKAREDKEYSIEKKQSLDTINLEMLDDSLDEDTLVKLSDALSLGYINEKEYQGYRDRITNGSPVTRDVWSKYTEVVNNVETYTVNDIANMDGLTDPTKKKFIAERLKWEESGNEWMTLPAYKEGKNVIRDSYGFPEKGLMPEFLSHDERAKYTEMVEIQHEYQQRIQEAVANGKHYNGVAIADELVNRQKDDLRSKMHGKYRDRQTVTTKMIKDEQTRTNQTLDTIMTKQYENNPDSMFENTIDKAVTEEAKGSKTESEGSETESKKPKDRVRSSRMTPEAQARYDEYIRQGGNPELEDYRPKYQQKSTREYEESQL